MYWSTGTLYSKPENRDYQKFALKLRTFSASLKLLYIDVRRLSFVERYAQKQQPSRQKEEKTITSNERPYFLIFSKVTFRRETFDISIGSLG